MAQRVKSPPANAEAAGMILGWGRSPGGGHGNPLQYSCLGNPMDRGAWWATVHGVTKSRTWLSHWTHSIPILQAHKLQGGESRSRDGQLARDRAGVRTHVCALTCPCPLRWLYVPRLLRIKKKHRYFLGGPVVKTALPMQGAWAPSPVGELDPTCHI